MLRSTSNVHFPARGWYFQNGGRMKLGMRTGNGFKIALATWKSWVENVVNPNITRVFFQTFESSHWSFALLRNPLLRFHEGVHPDYRIYLQCLFSALEPSSLSPAVYPLLSSYETPDKQAFPRHSLSRAGLLTSGSPIFFPEAFTTLIVFYSPTADPSLPFPPPQDCLLRTTINKLKQEQIITPKPIFIRGGQDDATAFENYLIEEHDVAGSGFSSVMGFVSFLDEINQDVLEYINKLNGEL
ncbi:sec23/sec24 transport family protein [Perilla frutescens var. hirtella]|nr:sec23/sec24 transport family protein [Perilla frutescens var. hirtella]